ncbi:MULTISPECIES: M91 family zinc metallopeptidase [Pseudomonas]|uniref:M91 family zinc metallopeptidase n=1 Tax=Pseudomonas TaxID=286 RepID=UPI00398FFE98
MITATHPVISPLLAPEPVTPKETIDRSRNRTLIDDGNVKIERILEQEDHFITTDEVRITTTDRNDVVRIHAGANGQVSATVNGQPYKLPLSRGDLDQILVIKTQGGDDKVDIDPDIKLPVNISTGDGNDRIVAGGGETRVFAGKGNDYIRLGSGNGLAFGEDGDDLMVAGKGNAVMSGGKGQDKMYAGSGPESREVYLSGDADDDKLCGGQGKVILNGGLGNDQLIGYRNTTIYTGNGQDSVHSFDARDRIYAKKTDRVHNHKGAKVNEVRPSEAGKRGFKVVGSPEFIRRVEDKLEELRSSPAGQQVLEEMDKLSDKIGSPVVIRSAGENGNIHSYRFQPISSDTAEDEATDENDAKYGFIKEGMPGAAATQAEITFAADSLDWRQGLSPLISIFHEMIHAYNGATGTFIPGKQPIVDKDGKPAVIDDEPVHDAFTELQAIGVPNAGTAFDFDKDPGTPPSTINPYPFYENALREELGVPLRTMHRDTE